MDKIFDKYKLARHLVANLKDGPKEYIQGFKDAADIWGIDDEEFLYNLGQELEKIDKDFL